MMTNSAQRLFEIECVGDTVIVNVQADLGEFEYEELVDEAQEAFDQLQAASHKKHVIIDFGHSDYFGSTAVGLLVNLWRRVRQRGGQMAICGLSAHEKEILKATNLDTLWPTCDSREAAHRFVTGTGMPGNSAKGV